jgi:uncharacterized membrane protein
MKWNLIPWPLWIYSAITVAATVSLLSYGPIVARVLFIVIMLVWLYLLLKGLRWVWTVTLGVYLLGFIDLIVGTLTWRGAAFGLVGLLLLLLPESREYFSKTPSAIDG